MKTIVTTLTIVMLIFIGLMSVSADESVDDRGSPNDPIVNERANACFEGGSMEGKCLTAWEWNCGWYAIRFEENQLTRDEFPAQCAVLLPSQAPAFGIRMQSGFALPTLTACLNIGDAYIQFSNTNTVGPSVPLYDDANCTQLNTVGTLRTVYAPDGIEAATQLCQSAFNRPIAETLTSEDLYICRDVNEG